MTPGYADGGVQESHPGIGIASPEPGLPNLGWETLQTGNLREAGLVSDLFQIPLELPVRNAKSPRPTIATGQAFVGSGENRLVQTALQSLLDATVASIPWPFSPLVLCGPSGVGKSMVANCIAGKWIEVSGSRSFLMTTGVDFRRGYAQAVKDDHVEPWRQRCRRASMILIDDMHQMQNAHVAQREMVLLLDDLQQVGVPVIVTMPTHPSAASELLNQLSSRLSGGLVVEVQTPGFAARHEILSQWSKQLEQPLSSGAIEWFASRFHGNVPSLRNRLHGSLAQTGERVPTQPVLRPELRKLVEQWEARQKYSIREITRVTCRYCQITRDKILGSSRKQPIVMARSLAMYLSKELGGFSLRDIGHFFGKRDHSTVLHAVNKIEKRIKTDPLLRLTVDDLRRILTSQN